MILAHHYVLLFVVVLLVALPVLAGEVRDATVSVLGPPGTFVGEVYSRV